jgi:hypothetical protein
MQFQMPQFIDVEDKIFGPLTFKQFIYVAGGLGLGYVSYRFLPGVFGIPVALAVAGFGALLAFYQYNQRPFIYVLQAWVTFMVSKKLYLWKRESVRQADKTKQSRQGPTSTTPEQRPLTAGSISQLSRNLDLFDQK